MSDIVKIQGNCLKKCSQHVKISFEFMLLNNTTLRLFYFIVNSD